VSIQIRSGEEYEMLNKTHVRYEENLTGVVESKVSKLIQCYIDRKPISQDEDWSSLECDQNLVTQSVDRIAGALIELMLDVGNSLAISVAVEFAIALKRRAWPDHSMLPLLDAGLLDELYCTRIEKSDMRLQDILDMTEWAVAHTPAFFFLNGAKILQALRNLPRLEFAISQFDRESSTCVSFKWELKPNFIWNHKLLKKAFPAMFLLTVENGDGRVVYFDRVSFSTRQVANQQSYILPIRVGVPPECDKLKLVSYSMDLFAKTEEVMDV